jgi:hypothetical protein
MPYGLGRKKEASSPAPKPGEDYAPGWEALDAVFMTAFPRQQAHHWMPNEVLVPAQDGVWGISAYRDSNAWFYVTYGLTDLFDLFRPPDPSEVKPDSIQWSGYGFELTMRVPSGEPMPPLWPVELLNKLGTFVFQTNAGFEDGHRLDNGGPITGGIPETRLTALAFTNDPAFEAIDTVLGRVEFLTAVGVTADELTRMKASSTATVLSELRLQSPSLVTDPHR